MLNNNQFSRSGVRFEPVGRNANLAGTMVKRVPIFNHNPVQKPQSTPFANYNCKLNESFVSQSQSTLQQEKINFDIVREIVKEEFSKIQKPEEGNRKIIATLQAQINDLKEKIVQNQKDNNKKVQQLGLTLKQEIKAQAEKAGKDVEVEISSKLRLFFQKANAELKKDILKTASEEFLSFSYGEDLQNRLETITEKIIFLSNNISEQNHSPGKSSQQVNTVLSETVELKLNKLEKELQNNNKILRELTTKHRNVQQWMATKNCKNEEESETILRLLKDKIKQTEQEIQLNCKKIGGLQIRINGQQSDIHSFKERLSEFQRQHDQQKLYILDFKKKLSQKNSDLQSSQLRAFLKNSSNLQTSTVIESNLLHTTSTKSQTDIKDSQKSLYQVDNEGYLMDGFGKYLLTEQGVMVKLTNEQISMLMDSKDIEIIEK